MGFRDRADAGRQLVEPLRRLVVESPVVLGLPRGGVPVAFEVARGLGAPLDVVMVRKLGVPYQPELAMGAVGEDGVRVVNRAVVDALGITDEQLLEAERRAATVLRSRAEIFRRARPRIPLTGRTVVIVDDGIATGATARAACEVVRASGATRVVVATPVAPAETVAELEDLADEVVCLSTPHPFYAIGPFYEDFAQVDDDVVVALLDRAAT